MVNYFELFGLPVSFHPDAATVKKKFYELSRQFHPDRFAQAGGDALDETLKISATINEAYRILKNTDATIQYILKYHGALEDEEKYNLPAEFLMEMMELNEAVDDNNPQLALSSWQAQNEQLNAALNMLTEKYDKGDRSEALLMEIKDYYFRKKYLLRIQERIAKFATP